MSLPSPGRYRHYKGHEYQVLDCARHSETEDWMVIYRTCYGEEGLWVRPVEMFTESVRTAEGDERPRFERIGD